MCAPLLARKLGRRPRRRRLSPPKPRLRRPQKVIGTNTTPLGGGDTNVEPPSEANVSPAFQAPNDESKSTVVGVGAATQTACSPIVLSPNCVSSPAIAVTGSENVTAPVRPLADSNTGTDDSKGAASGC